MKKVYWKDIINKDIQEEFLKLIVNKNITSLDIIEEISIQIELTKSSKIIEIYIPFKDIIDFF